MNPTPQEDDLIVIGKLGKVHGLRGEARLWVYNPQTEVLRPGLTLWLRAEHSQALVPVTLRSARAADRFWIIAFEQLSERGQIDPLINAELLARRDDFPPIDEDEYYLVDLIGLPVRVANDDDPDTERTIGVVADFFETAAHDVMRITLHDQSTVLAPFVEPFLLDVDLAQGVLLASPSQWAPQGTDIP